MKITQTEQQNVKRVLKSEDTVWELWDNIKQNNIHIIRFPEGQEREKGTEKLFEEIMAENFPNLEKETDIQTQKAQRVPKDGPKEKHNKTHYN